MMLKFTHWHLLSTELHLHVHYHTYIIYIIIGADPLFSAGFLLEALLTVMVGLGARHDNISRRSRLFSPLKESFLIQFFYHECISQVSS